MLIFRLAVSQHYHRIPIYDIHTDNNRDVDAIFDVDQLGDTLDVNLHGLLQPTCGKSCLSDCHPPPPSPSIGHARTHSRTHTHARSDEGGLAARSKPRNTERHPCVCAQALRHAHPKCVRGRGREGGKGRANARAHIHSIFTPLTTAADVHFLFVLAVNVHRRAGGLLSRHCWEVYCAECAGS